MGGGRDKGVAEGEARGAGDGDKARGVGERMRLGV